MFIKGDVVKYNKYYNKYDNRYGEVISFDNKEIIVKFTYPFETIPKKMHTDFVRGDENMFCLVYRPFDLFHYMNCIVVYFAGTALLLGSIVSFFIQEEPPFWVIILLGISGTLIFSFLEIYQKVKKKMEYLNNQGG